MPELCIRIALTDEASFIESCCRSVSGNRMFMLTRTPEPVGKRVQFRVELADGRVVLRGNGPVVETRADDDGVPLGMMVRFSPSDEASAVMLTRLQEARRRPSSTGPLQQLVPECDAVPANPLDGITEGAIEHFVDRSLAAPKRKRTVEQERFAAETTRRGRRVMVPLIRAKN